MFYLSILLFYFLMCRENNLNGLIFITLLVFYNFCTNMSSSEEEVLRIAKKLDKMAAKKTTVSSGV